MDGILPYEIMGNAKEYWCRVAGFIILSVMILLAPAVTKDSLTGICDLQYSGKFGAMILSAAGLMFFELLIFSALYAQLETWTFGNNPIISFLCLVISV